MFLYVSFPHVALRRLATAGGAGAPDRGGCATGRAPSRHRRDEVADAPRRRHRDLKPRVGSFRFIKGSRVTATIVLASVISSGHIVAASATDTSSNWITLCVNKET
jgi:hypothetical protein